MARRIPLAAVVLGGGAIGLAFACVDLFHSTEFTTLCTAKPDDPQCGKTPVAEGGTDAGVDAKKPPIDFCKLTSAEAKDRAIRACAYLGACGGSIDNNAFGECVRRAQLAMDCAANPALRPAGAHEALWQCLASVESCAEVEACVFGDLKPPCKPLTDAGFFVACAKSAGGVSSIRFECRDIGTTTAGRFESCILANEICTTTSESTAACTGVAGDKCTSSAACRGSNAVTCDGPKIDRGIDCAGVGAGSCSEEDGGPACVPVASTPACTSATSASASCDGTKARACVGGKEIVIDCAKLGLDCDDSATAPTYDPASKCVRTKLPGCSDVNDRCEGDDLQGCAKSETYVASCKSLGLGPCTVVGSRATCTKP